MSEAAVPVQLGPKPPSAGDNLWQGRSEAEVHGDTQGSMIRPSLYTRAAAHPVFATAVGGAAIAGVSYLLRRRANGASQTISGSDVDGDSAAPVMTGETAPALEPVLDITAVEVASTDQVGAIGLEEVSTAGNDEALNDGDGPDEGAISNGMNARPLNDTISQSGPGIPDDTSKLVEITPEEEARVAERIRSL